MLSSAAPAAIVRLIGNIIIVFPLLRPAAVPSMWHCRAWRASIAAARLETAPESVCIVTSDPFGGSARQRRKAGPRLESGLQRRVARFPRPNRVAPRIARGLAFAGQNAIAAPDPAPDTPRRCGTFRRKDGKSVVSG